MDLIRRLRVFVAAAAGVLASYFEISSSNSGK